MHGVGEKISNYLLLTDINLNCNMFMIYELPTNVKTEEM